MRLRIAAGAAVAFLLTSVFLSTRGAASAEHHPGLQPDKAKSEVGAKELDQLWTELGDADAEKAFKAMLTLIAAPKQTTAYFKTHLHPVKPADPKEVQQLLEDLNSDKFAVRDQATKKLEGLGELARSVLEKKLAANPTLEMRKRIEGLLLKLEGPVTRPEVLRGLRAIEVLERIASPEALLILETMAGGAPGTSVTEDAAATVARLKGKPKGS